MDKSTHKLISLLKRTYNELTQIIRTSYFTQKDEDREKSLVTCHFTGNFGLWLTQTEEFRKKHKLIFDEFPVLSSILESPEFNRRDVFTIITNVIKLNIENSILDDDMEVKVSEIDDIKYIETLTTPEALRGYADDKTYYDTYVKIERIKYEHEDTTEKNYQGLFNKELVNLPNLKRQHAIINANYLTQLESYTLADVEVITAALSELGISEYCVQTIKEQLIVRLEKRNKPTITPASNIIRPQVFSQPQPSYSRREYKMIMKELSSYYDFELKTPIRTLTYDEIVYLIARLKKLDWSKENLEMLLHKIDKYNLQNDPSIHCQNLLIRLRNHSMLQHETSDLTDIKHAIKSLEEYLLELQSCESIKDQQEWQEIMKEEINYANSLIPRTI